jgi:hypothetical protein
MFKKALAIIFLISVFSSCKKGPDDPLVSLRSRKARLAGEWRLSSATVKINYFDHVTFERYNLNYKMTGSRYDVMDTYGNTDKGAYVLSLNVEKDGEFSMHEIIGLSNKMNEITGKGNWDFALKSEDTKKKEEVNFILYQLSKGSTAYYHLFNWGATTMRFKIKELRHKKLVLSVSNIVFVDTRELTVDYTGDFTFTQ